MRTLSVDTTPEAEAIQIALFRAAGPLRRSSLACSLSGTAIELSRRAIRRSHPAASELEIGLLFITFTYGAELAKRVRADLERRGRL